MDVSADHLLGEARVRFGNRDYYGTLHCLDDVEVSGRAFADVHQLRGLALSLLDRPSDALVEFDRALALNPRYVEALLHRGLALNQLGRADEAAAAFAQASNAAGPPVAGLSSSAAARLANEHARLGDLYAEAGALAEAVLEYRRAVELGVRFPRPPPAVGATPPRGGESPPGEGGTRCDPGGPPRLDRCPRATGVGPLPCGRSGGRARGLARLQGRSPGCGAHRGLSRDGGEHTGMNAQQSRVLSYCVVLLVAVTAACGGKGGSSTPAPVSSGTASAASIDSMWVRADDLYAREKWDDAAVAYERVQLEMRSGDPRIPRARFQLAEVRLRQKSNLQAVREFRRVSDDFSGDSLAPVALVRAGDAYAALWRRPELDPTYGTVALATYQEVVSRFPGTPVGGRRPDTNCRARGQVCVQGLPERRFLRALQGVRLGGAAAEGPDRQLSSHRHHPRGARSR